jgi:general secretion pathway protein E
MEQAIALLKTSRPTFYRWLRSGRIKAMKVGRQWRFYREDIERFLRGQEPRVDLAADLSPLIGRLRARLEELGVPPAPAAGEDESVVAVGLMIRLALAMQASDIHLAPQWRPNGQGSVALLRYRVDGVLHPFAEIDIRLLRPLAERWLTMAACDIRQTVKPQDGRILVKLADSGKLIDLRVSYVPLQLGMSLTARVLDPDIAQLLTLDRMGYSERDKERLLHGLGVPWGMLMVTGPTGCGKTTTIYACLNRLAGPQTKVMTIEDPIELFLPWVEQIPVRPQDGVTFGVAVRSMLRSAANVIMIGEIRDFETLQLAHQSALTGHLVLTTLHADEAARALVRMVEIGSDPFLVADSTKLTASQRLVRCLCRECSVEDAPLGSVLERAAELATAGGLDWASLPKGFRRPVGCAKCHQTGFRGREVVAEVLEVTPEIGAALRKGASVDELRALAVRQGMTTMAADGIRKAAAGTTSLEEALRVLREL